VPVADRILLRAIRSAKNSDDRLARCGSVWVFLRSWGTGIEADGAGIRSDVDPLVVVTVFIIAGV